MTEQVRAGINVALVSVLCGLGGSLLGIGVAWGTLHQRVIRLEVEYMDQRPVLLRIDRNLFGIEQGLRDMDRRIERLEGP